MPTFTHGRNAVVLVNGYDLTSYFNSTETSKSSDTADVSTFGDVAKNYVAGMTDATLKMDGFFDKTAAAEDPVLVAALGASASIVTHLPDGHANSKTGFSVSAIETAYEVSSATTDANKITASFQSQVGGEYTTSLAALAARTGGGTVAGKDFTTGSTGTGCGYLHCTALTGGTAVVKIQDSADNVTYVDLVTFADITAANTAQRVLAAGTVGRYVRTTHVVTGGTATFWTGICRSAEL